MLRGSVKLNPTISLADSATTVLCSSSYGMIDSPTAGTMGNYRGLWAGVRVVIGILCTGQNVTVKTNEFDSAGVAKTMNGSGSGTTITAAAAWQTINFLPGTDDFEVLIVNGGTGPTTCKATVTLVRERVSGS